MGDMLDGGMMGSMMGRGMTGGMMGGGMTWGGLVWAVLVLLLLGGIVAVAGTAIVQVVRRQPPRIDYPQVAPVGARPGTDILRRRYAAGEIDEGEFERRAAFLQKH